MLRVMQACMPFSYLCRSTSQSVSLSPCLQCIHSNLPAKVQLPARAVSSWRFHPWHFWCTYADWQYESDFHCISSSCHLASTPMQNMFQPPVFLDNMAGEGWATAPNQYMPDVQLNPIHIKHFIDFADWDIYNAHDRSNEPTWTCYTL